MDATQVYVKLSWLWTPGTLVDYHILTINLTATTLTIITKMFDWLATNVAQNV